MDGEKEEAGEKFTMRTRFVGVIVLRTSKHNHFTIDKGLWSFIQMDSCP